MFGIEALKACLKLPDIWNVLDVGSGAGEQARVFQEHGKDVATLDRSTHLGVPDVKADFNTHRFGRTRFDLVWCCHVLEHQRNPGFFLEKLANCCAPGGHICITVPPAKHNIVGGHVTLWNGGLLLYKMVLAGIDCREARLLQYDYNISVLVPFRERVDLDGRGLVLDAGDLEKLQDLFPFPLTQKANGDIERHNWT